MTLIMVTKSENITPFRAIHVGMMLKPELEERGISQKELAKMIGMQPSHLSELMKGKRPMTTDIAFKIQDAIGISANVLMSMQAQYEHDVEIIKRRGIEEMAASNELADYDNTVDVKTLAKAFNLVLMPLTAQLDGLKQMCKSNSAAEMQVAFSDGHFRKSDRNDSDPRMVNTWILIARYQARKSEVKGIYDVSLVEELAQKLKRVFTENINTIKRVSSLCSEYGIRFATCDGLPHTKIDGYSFVEDGIPAIVITNRYKRIDSMAFNVLHELGHLVCSPASSHINLENYSKEDPEEKAADAFANNILIPSSMWKRSPEVKMNPRDIQRKFTAWAEQEGINKWIALGRASYETGIYAFSDPQKTRRIT